jgi:hypothetical protein
MDEGHCSLTAADQLYVTRRSSVNTSHRLSEESGLEGSDQHVLAGVVSHKPGHVGHQPPVALRHGSRYQRDGVLRSKGETGRRQSR